MASLTTPPNEKPKGNGWQKPARDGRQPKPKSEPIEKAVRPIAESRCPLSEAAPGD